MIAKRSNFRMQPPSGKTRAAQSSPPAPAAADPAR
jgi:hypothetical protein